LKILAIFGPTAVGKTGVAIAVAELLRERREDPVAVNCDAIQVYRGLDVLSGAADADQRARLEHRLLGFVDVSEEFSAGRYAERAHAEIDELLAASRRPIVVGGTGLYLRAALAELDLRPPVAAAVREEVEREIAEHGPEALHAELAPAVAAAVHPNDRKRVARSIELQRSGLDPPVDSEQLWTQELRHATLLVGLTMEPDELDRRIDARVDAMAAAGAADESRRADAAGASRTARAALGFKAFAAGDIESVKTAHRRYARRQTTWMRKMPDVQVIDRSGRDDDEVATELIALLDR
jgi:tRNA dimethylallyltransferase